MSGEINVLFADQMARNGFEKAHSWQSEIGNQ